MKKSQIRKVKEVMQKNKLKWMPAYYFVGLRQGIDGLVFLSYKAPARLSEIFREYSSTHVERRLEMRSGSKFYSYKLVKNFL